MVGRLIEYYNCSASTMITMYKYSNELKGSGSFPAENQKQEAITNYFGRLRFFSRKSFFN